VLPPRSGDGVLGPHGEEWTHPSNHNREEKIKEWLPKAHEKAEASECSNTGRYVQDFRSALGGFGGGFGGAFRG
jgi:hypothetical protein